MARFYEAQLARQLEPMGEPSLWQLSKQATDVTMYRVLVVPTWSQSIARRLVVQADGSGRVFISELDGRGGYDSGKLKSKRTVNVSAEDVSALEVLFENAGFWTDRVGTESKELDLCLDGVMYVIEGVRRKNYKLVMRSSCMIESDVDLWRIVTALMSRRYLYNAD